MKDTPLISCLCITYKRPSFLKRSIQCFENQTYSNKELIIVHQDNDEITHLFAEQNPSYSRVSYESGTLIKKHHGASSITFIQVSVELSLGEKRNLSVEFAHGDFVCIWDDDDFHAKHRLAYQIEFLLFSKKASNVLANLTLYDERSGKYYTGPHRSNGWEGSLLCRKDQISKYHHLNKQEDTPVVVDLYSRNELSVMEQPELYVYHLHSQSTSGFGHFDEMIHYSIEVHPSAYEELTEAAESMV